MGLETQSAASRSTSGICRKRYTPPVNVGSASLRELVALGGRGPLEERQFALLSGRKDDPDVDIYFSVLLELLKRPAVSIVGTRDVSEDGRLRARRLARELSNAGVIVVSGLARGVDAAAHQGALEEDGKTIAVIGTPLDKAYPRRECLIARSHLSRSPSDFAVCPK